MGPQTLALTYCFFMPIFLAPKPGVSFPRHDSLGAPCLSEQCSLTEKLNGSFYRHLADKWLTKVVVHPLVRPSTPPSIHSSICLSICFFLHLLRKEKAGCLTPVCWLGWSCTIGLHHSEVIIYPIIQGVASLPDSRSLRLPCLLSLAECLLGRPCGFYVGVSSGCQ